MSDLPPVDAIAVEATADETAPVLWAGEQVTSAVRRFPLIGEVASTTTIRTIATVTVGDDGSYTLVDSICTMDIVQDGPLALSFADHAVRRLPAATSTWTPVDATAAAAPARYEAEAWKAGWGSTDVELDGRPGLAVDVDASVCSGSLDLASHTTSTATAAPVAGGLAGDVEVHIEREILRGSNPCLSLVPRRSEERVTGTFAFVPVPSDATCASLEQAGWPAKAPASATNGP